VRKQSTIPSGFEPKILLVDASDAIANVFRHYVFRQDQRAMRYALRNFGEHFVNAASLQIRAEKRHFQLAVFLQQRNLRGGMHRFLLEVQSHSQRQLTRFWPTSVPNIIDRKK